MSLRAMSFMVWAFAPLGFGCGELAGLDEFEVSEGCPAGSLPGASGRCVRMPQCAENQLPRADGTCSEELGVPPESCAERRFEPDPDRPGGCRALFPTDCPTSSLAPLGARTCSAAFACSDNFAQTAAGLFVDEKAGSGGTGSHGSPLRTIREALDIVVSQGLGSKAEPAPIYVYRGSDAGSLRFERPVRIEGICVYETLIVGDDRKAPVIELGPDAAGSAITGVSVTGQEASAGIRVNGAKDVALGGSLIVGPVSGPGVVLEDTAGELTGTLNGVAIDRPTGIGIAIYGATDLRLNDVRVIDSQPISGEGRSVGIRIAASVGNSTLPPTTVWDALTARRSKVTIDSSRIEGASGAGIVVEGSDVEVTATSVRRVDPDANGRSSGILVERRWFGDLHANLTLRQSLIADVRGSAIHADDVDVVRVEDTTIRDIEASNQDLGAFGGCQGNGVRVRSRFERPVESGETALSLSHVLIDGARESGVHVEGALAKLETSLIRNVRGCDGQFGDGLVAYGYPFSRTAIDLEKTRVGGAARSAVAVFDADLKMTDSALDSCTPLAKIGDAGVVDLPRDSLCQCNARITRCASVKTSTEPALLGYSACDPSRYACSKVCAIDLLSAAASGAEITVTGFAAWDIDHDGVASKMADPNGCYESVAAPDHSLRLGVSGPSFTPAVGMNLVPQAGRLNAPVIELLGGTNAFGAQSAVFFPEREPADARNALYVNFTICQAVAEALTEPREVCFGHGVEGAEAELLDDNGAQIAAAWATPYYFGLSTPQPDPCRTPSLSPPNCREPRAYGVSEHTSAGYFYNVPPGKYRIRVFKRGSAPLRCNLAPGWLGWPTSEQNVFRLNAEAAWNNAGVRAFCK